MKQDWGGGKTLPPQYYYWEAEAPFPHGLPPLTKHEGKKAHKTKVRDEEYYQIPYYDRRIQNRHCCQSLALQWVSL